jgi:membrane protein DedA with SNARE-associated domain
MKTTYSLTAALVLFFSFLSAPAFAHEDHFLGDGLLHSFYHIIFIGLCVLVVIKAYKWISVKRAAKKLAK